MANGETLETVTDFILGCSKITADGDCSHEIKRHLLLGRKVMTKPVEVMEFQLSYFKSWKMMLWKCCTQYASKFGKFSSGHSTGKGQFSFQSQRKAVPKNAQTTTQLHSSHTLVKWCLKFSKPAFSNTWMVNFQMFKLVLEKAKEPDSNCQHLLDHQKSKRIPEKLLFPLYWLCQSLWLCGSQ